MLQVNATATINAVARLSINTTATTLLAPKAADFGAAAGVNSTGPTITVKSNQGYTLTASAAASTWTGTGGGANTKPATDLTFNVNGGSFAPLGQIAQSNAATAGTAYTIGYKTTYNFAVDKPGNYALVVNYTLTSP
jgi:hypothetical protein